MGLIRGLIVGIGLVVMVGIFMLLIRNGAFKSVEFSVEERGPLELIYKEHIGPYHKIIDDLQAVEKTTKNAGLTCNETFGEYLDNPNSVEMERLKSNVGCITSTPLSQAPEGLKYRTIAARNFLVAKFLGSPALGPYKVYGKAVDQMINRHLASDGAVIEVYRELENQGFETTYLFPVKEISAPK